VIHDLRHVLRAFRRTPIFAVSTVLVLALGIGANTAVFSVVYAVLLKPLPYAEPDRLVKLAERHPSKGADEGVLSAGTFVDWRARSHTLESLAVYAPLFGNGETVWNIGDRAQIIKTAGASTSLFAVLRVQPIRGRLFRPENETPPPGALGQFVISYGLWQRAFGGSEDIVGRRVDLEGRLPREIIGVMPPGFDFPDGTEAWTGVPLSNVPVAERRARSFEAIGRLSPGVRIDDVRRELVGISTQLAAEFPASNDGWIPDVEPASNSKAASARLALLVLMTAVACVLLIACANVANLLLARAAARRTEIAVRLALGASTSRLVRHSLLEAAVLCAAGAALGLLIGSWIAGVLGRLAPIDLASAGGVMHVPVLIFAIAACALCAALIGIVPVLHVTRSLARGGLRGDLRASTAHGAGLRRWVVGAEAAVVVLLLTGALLFLRTFMNLRRVDLGFQPAHALSVETRWPVGYLLVAAPGTRPWPRVQRIVDDLVRVIEGVPGVQAAGLITEIPLTSDPAGVTIWRADAPGAGGGQPAVDARDRFHADLTIVTRGYFPAMNIAVVRGRNFDDTDRFSVDVISRSGSAKPIGSAIVNSAFASRYFGGESPVGHVIVIDDDREFGPMRTIVGVVADSRQRAVAEAPRPTLFIPHAQHPDMIRPSFVVRTTASPGAAALLIRERLLAFDPQLVVLGIRPMDDVISSALSRPRFNLLLMASFAAVALLLSGLGIYGVLAYVVAERTREIGIRMALGARAADVVRLMLREGLASVAIGAGIGVAAALAMGRLLRTLLFGVTPIDPISLAGAPLMLAAIAAFACYLPTRRATKVDPIVALRED